MNVEFCVKISVGKRRSHIVDDVVYYRRYMDFDFVLRWQWYFHYISALVQVRHPELFVRTFIGRTDMLTPAEYIEKRLKDLENGVVDFWVYGDYINKIKSY